MTGPADPWGVFTEEELADQARKAKARDAQRARRARQDQPAPAPDQDPADPWAIPAEVLDEQRRQAEAIASSAEARQQAASDPAPAAPAPTPPKPRKARRRRPRAPGSSTRYSRGTLVAKYEGWCGKCDVKIYPGDVIKRVASTADPVCQTCAGRGE